MGFLQRGVSLAEATVLCSETIADGHNPACPNPLPIHNRIRPEPPAYSIELSDPLDVSDVNRPRVFV
jgi:hypothetical protein